MKLFPFSPLLLLAFAAPALADAPGAAYIFPAGGQRGTTVDVRVGGYFLHEQAPWQMLGDGVSSSAELRRIERLWFEGPLIRQPASQQKEDYPQDYAARVEIAAQGASGPRLWRAWNGQGATSALPFIVGHLPELVEQEIDGRPIAVSVPLPVTINGRIFPREDVDIWRFTASAGQTITCSVAAAEFGSPLQAWLEVRNSQGFPIAEKATGGLQPDPQLRFTAKVAGDYEVRICDTRYSGLQDFVYRLTITADTWVDTVFPLGGQRGKEVALALTGQHVPVELLKVTLPDIAPGQIQHEIHINGAPANRVLLDIDDVDEVLEPTAGALPLVPLPGVANGHIEAPGDRDAWTFHATKGTLLLVELRAARLRSPLDGVLVITDASGKELARGDDLPDGSPDAEARFTAPEDGAYTVDVSEKFAARGGSAFAYRLKISPEQPDFWLTLAGDVHMVEIGGEKKLSVAIERRGGFVEPIQLAVTGLPDNVSAAEVTVAANQNKADLTLKVAATAPVQTARIGIVGRAQRAGEMLERRAAIVHPAGLPMPDHLLLACALPTPFRLRGEYALRYVPRGGVMKKSFQIERGGYGGPIEVRLADRQGRHLQGVSGPVVTVPPEQTEFEYPLSLPPWMEMGRTSRTNLMLTGEVADAAGVRHKISFSTTEQNEQLIAIVSPALLRISLERAALPYATRSELVVPVLLHRDRALQGAVKLELVLPAHVKEVRADAVIAPATATTAELRLQLGAQAGPFTQPLVIRATSDHHGQPMVAETALDLVTGS